MPSDNKTFLFDIDGTLINHPNTVGNVSRCKVLPGVLDTLSKLREQGHLIFLTTAREEKDRSYAVTQMKLLGIEYDQLIMGLTCGCRVIVNDTKPYPGWEDRETCVAIMVERDAGISHKNLMEALKNT